MDTFKAKDIFLAYTELTDLKVDMAVNRAIDRVIDQITSLRDEIGSLKNEMNIKIGGLKDEMNNRFSSLDNRVIAIETKLGMVNAKRKGWYDRFMDHFFKAGWAWLSIIFAFLILHLK